MSVGHKETSTMWYPKSGTAYKSIKLTKKVRSRKPMYTPEKKKKNPNLESFFYASEPIDVKIKMF